MQVSLAHLRAHVVAKQGLSGPGLRSLTEATLASGCLYATAPTCYLGYSARVEGFTVGHLDRELYERRSLVRLRAMRGSSYIVPVELLPAVVGATWEVTGGTLDRMLRQAGISAEDYRAQSARIEELMAGRGPMAKGAIRDALGVDGPEISYLVAAMASECRVVRATVRGGWRSDSYLYALWEEWLGAPLDRLPVETARAEVARLYLRACGPATAADLAWWAGFKPAVAAGAIERLGDEVDAVEVDGHTMFVLADEREALVAADPAAPAGARLLAVWDAYLMAWKDRRRFVSDEHRPLVYDKAGNGTSTLLLDGAAAGVWEFDVDRRATGLTIRVAPFAPLSAARWREVEGAAERIAATVGAASLDFERSGHAPRPLGASSARNAFLAPIRLGAA